MLAAVAGVQSGSEHPWRAPWWQRLRSAAWHLKRPMACVPCQGGAPKGGAGPDLAHWQPALDAGAGRARAARSRGEGAANAGPLAQRALALQQEGLPCRPWPGPRRRACRVLALLAFGDEPKPGAREALAALKARASHGDDFRGQPGRGRGHGLPPGLDPAAGEVMAEVLPGDKAAQIQLLQRGNAANVKVGRALPPSLALWRW